ncbi:Uncharacterised protein [Chlamydia trachomatis]|nr:Uncharacterised protein [Chlamydia trachomatis]
MQSMNAPTKGPVPLITAVVKPPIFKDAGKHEFTKHPINRGTTIVAPGIFIFFKSIFVIWLFRFANMIFSVSRLIRFRHQHRQSLR